MNISGRPEPVLAGIDGSAAAEAAGQHAAWQARRRGAELLLVQGVRADGLGPGADPSGPDHAEPARLAAHLQLEQSAQRLQSEFPGLPIGTRVVAGSGALALVGESRSAGLVVLGARGAGGFDGLLIGAVAAQVSSYAATPVMVIREGRSSTRPAGRPGPVLLAVDGGAPSVDAIAFAFDEAAARQVGLVVVQVWSVPAITARSVGTVWARNSRGAQSQLRAVADQILDEALAGWPVKYPQVEVDRRSVHGDHPARTLLAVAAHLDPGLIVVGRRPTSLAQPSVGSDVVLASVGQTLAEHATGSVAVIHPIRR